MTVQNFATAAFYDDARREVSGKVTFVGRYNRELLVQNFPHTITAMHIDVTYGTDVRTPDFLKEIRLTIPNEPEPIVVPLEAPLSGEQLGPIPDDAKVIQFTVGIPIAGIEANAPSEIVVHTYSTKGTHIIAGRLKINTAPKPSAVNWHQAALQSIINHFSSIEKTGDISLFDLSASTLMHQIVASSVCSPDASQTECRIALSPRSCLVLLPMKVENLASKLVLRSEHESFETLNDIGFRVLFSEDQKNPRAVEFEIQN
ncbi:hypothetical protein [Thalassospira sp. MCCC 1A03138]|uniref:hypothetical protein n=1 Tax=Thalassospira sp. MCCC 1A03138 TaxID=1470576 RepID=UPI000A1F3668|nr:hypothetical protein [Thalassospira sp. MCCC 1A03138]OSQ30275.1 hypothetical protein TH468_12565 [Thalassospira sp. MCCC 1A03138]